MRCSDFFLPPDPPNGVKWLSEGEKNKKKKKIIFVSYFSNNSREKLIKLKTENFIIRLTQRNINLYNNRKPYQTK